MWSWRIHIFVLLVCSSLRILSILFPFIQNLQKVVGISKFWYSKSFNIWANCRSYVISDFEVDSVRIQQIVDNLVVYFKVWNPYWHFFVFGLNYYTLTVQCSNSQGVVRLQTYRFLCCPDSEYRQSLYVSCLKLFVRKP